MKDKAKVRIGLEIKLALGWAFVSISVWSVPSVVLCILCGVLLGYIVAYHIFQNVGKREERRKLREYRDKELGRMKKALKMCGQGDAAMGNEEYKTSWRYERALYKIKRYCCPMGGKPSCPEIAKEALDPKVVMERK